MKTRMSIDDIHAMVGSIRKSVRSMRVTNIYDISQAKDNKGSARTYVFKLHQPPFPKVFLLLESGVRFHTSKYARDASSGRSALPSQFTMKLRKHLRGKRLTSLDQLQGDRVIDFTFGSDELKCHLILELYASGNIILTDGDYSILSLLRTHRFDDQVKVAVKQQYPVQVLEDATADFQNISSEELVRTVEKYFHDLPQESKQGKKKSQQTLKQLLLNRALPFGKLGPVLIEHCIVTCGLKPSMKIKSPQDLIDLGGSTLSSLVSELSNGFKLLLKLQEEQNSVLEGEGSATDRTNCGFIITKDESEADYEEFAPFLYAQHQGKHVMSFSTFDEAVDEYFSKIEAQSAHQAQNKAQQQAETKLQKLKKNQQNQIQQLRQEEESSWAQAALLELNQQDVENVLAVVRSALASGMDWTALHELVKYEQKNGNPVASLINQMDLARNRISVLLCDEEGELDEEDSAAHEVWIDLSLSALANAREIYARKKKAGEKVKKATSATDKAIERAEKQTQQAVAKHQMTKTTIFARRKPLWFEKFNWFLSSEKYLVVAGKDAHQNELLVKRYLRKGDLYVHADMHGAATCIIRNRDAQLSIPVSTIEQAGCMSVCRSSAWNSQVVASAYWVHAEQVSKTAPAGEYLSTGSFMVRGKKNYIHPSRLEMGLGIVFRIDESSIKNHQSSLPTVEAQPPMEPVGEDEGSEEEAIERPVETSEQQETVVSAPPPPTKLSAKERRELKKGRPQVKEEKKKSTRGKKGKMKKMKKYAEQDEEDRRVRMEALGHKMEKVEELEEAPKEEVEEKKEKEKEVVDEKYIEEQRAKKEQFLEEQEEEAESAGFFDAFTGEPTPLDLVHSAMTMCAPYAALNKFKYKVKLLPGSQKKGKAAKQAMEYFLSSNLKEEKNRKKEPKKTEEEGSKEQEKADEETPDVDPLIVQRELMKTIGDNELINCMVGPVKLSAPGLHAAKEKKPKGKKK